MNDIFKYLENEKIGFKTQSTKIIEPIYDDAKEFINDLNWVKKDNQWILIDLNNKTKINNQFDNVLFFDQNFAICKKNNINYYVDQINFKIKEVKFEYIEANEEFILWKDKDSYFYSDTELNFFKEHSFEQALLFNDGFASVKKNNKWGLIDKSFKLVIDFKYDTLFKYSNYLIKAILNNETYFIDLNENIYLKEIANKYIFNNIFDDYGILFKYNDKQGFMNEFFEILFLKNISIESECFDGYFIFKKNNKYGIINVNGKKIIEPKYDSITYLGDKICFVTYDKQINYLDLSTKKLLF